MRPATPATVCCRSEPGRETYGETRCDIRDPDGSLIDVGQGKPDVTNGYGPPRMGPGMKHQRQLVRRGFAIRQPPRP